MRSGWTLLVCISGYSRLLIWSYSICLAKSLAVIEAARPVLQASWSMRPCTKQGPTFMRRVTLIRSMERHGVHSQSRWRCSIRMFAISTTPTACMRAMEGLFSRQRKVIGSPRRWGTGRDVYLWTMGFWSWEGLLTKLLSCSAWWRGVVRYNCWQKLPQRMVSKRKSSVTRKRSIISKWQVIRIPSTWSSSQTTTTKRPCAKALSRIRTWYWIYHACERKVANDWGLAWKFRLVWRRTKGCPPLWGNNTTVLQQWHCSTMTDKDGYEWGAKYINI